MWVGFVYGITILFGLSITCLETRRYPLVLLPAFYRHGTGEALAVCLSS